MQHCGRRRRQGSGSGSGATQDAYDVNAGITMGGTGFNSGDMININSPASLSVNGVALTQIPQYCNFSAQWSPGFGWWWWSWPFITPYISGWVPTCNDYNYHMGLVGTQKDIVFTAVDNYGATSVNTFTIPTITQDPNLTIKCAVSSNSQILFCNMDDILPQFSANLAGYNSTFYPLDGVNYSFKKADNSNMFVLYGHKGVSTLSSTPPNMQALFSKQSSLQNATPAGGEYFFEYFTPQIHVEVDPTKTFDSSFIQNIFHF